MRIIIEHRKTKREISGPFNFIANKEDIQKLKYILDDWLAQDIVYGWIRVDELIDQPGDFDIKKIQKSIANTEPISWD